jgi:hypothetical protein
VRFRSPHEQRDMRGQWPRMSLRSSGLRVRVLAVLLRPRDVSLVSLSEREGAGSTGCWPHPRALRAKKSALCARKQHRAAEQPALPAQWVTAYTCSPRRAGLSGHRRLPRNVARNLIPASGNRDHTISPSAVATFVSRSVRVHRIPAPRIATIGRNVPLHRGGMREKVVVICPTAQAKKCATDWHDGQIGHGACAGLAALAVRKQ